MSNEKYLNALQELGEFYNSNKEKNYIVMVELIRLLNEVYIYSDNSISTISDIWEAID